MNHKKIHAEFIQYRRNIENISENTCRVYKESFDSYSAYCDYICEQMTFSTKQLIGYFIYIRERRHYKATASMVRRKGLKAYCTYLVKAGQIQLNPFETIAKPLIGRHLPKFLTFKQATLIIESIEGYPYKSKLKQYRDLTTVGLFMFCGLRRNELLHLRINDIDITTNHTILIINAKGEKDRVVKIHPRLEEWLKKYLKLRGSQPTDRLLISSSRCTQPFYDSGLKKLWRQVKTQTGIHVFNHLLRSTAATLLLHGGASIEVVKQILGHTKIGTTAIYLGCDPAMQMEGILKHPLGKI